MRSCAWTCGALAILAGIAVAAVVAVGGWYLFREGRPHSEERFLTGTETHYVSLRLRPDDEGMRRLALAGFERIEASFFVAPATPSWLRSGRMEGWLEMLPATVEWAGDSGDDGAVRIRFEGSHASARALFRILRWGASATNRVPGAPRAAELPGDVPAVFLPLRDDGALEVAFVGNRLLASREEGRLAEILRRPSFDDGTPSPERPPDGAAFSREDGWGWTGADGLGTDCRVVYSLHLESDDILAFRARPAERCPGATDDAARTALSASLRGEAERVAAAAGLAILERPDVAWSEDGDWIVSGRVAGLRERTLAAIPDPASVPGAYGEAEPVR